MCFDDLFYKVPKETLLIQLDFLIVAHDLQKHHLQANEFISLKFFQRNKKTTGDLELYSFGWLVPFDEVSLKIIAERWWFGCFQK